MGRVRVVTDSTADLDRAIAAELGVSIVPHMLHWSGRSYRDGVDITLDDFYRMLREGHGTPTTSRLSPGQLATVYSQLLREADSIVSIHLSSNLSGTFHSAKMAAQEVASGRISVVDSRTLSGSLGMVVLRVAALAQQGASLDECVALAEDLIPRSRLFIALDTLEFLRRGGRIGRVQFLAASLLSVKPIVQVVDGIFVPVERTRSRSTAIRRLAALVGDLGPLEEAAILYGDDPEPANLLITRIREACPATRVTLGRTGPACGTHAGPGVFGVALLRC